ncbi:MAG: hypothetical protein WDO74_09070 [Pseudomonadota bacterium]
MPRCRARWSAARVGTRLNRNIELSLRARWLHQRFDGLESSEYPGLGRYLTDLPTSSDRVALHLVENLRLGRGAALRLSLGRQWVAANSGNFRRDSPLGQEHVSSQIEQSFEATATFADGPRTWVIGSRFENAALVAGSCRHTNDSTGLWSPAARPKSPPRG